MRDSSPSAENDHFFYHQIDDDQKELTTDGAGAAATAAALSMSSNNVGGLCGSALYGSGGGGSSASEYANNVEPNKYSSNVLSSFLEYSSGGSSRHMTNRTEHPLYDQRVCRWPGCELLFEGFPDFLK